MIFARAAYSLATCLLSPFALARASARQTPLREYLGFAPLSGEHQNGIWLHAVSAGEAGAAAGLLRRLAAARPDMPLVLTHTTDAGRERFSQIAAEIRRADPRARVAVCACPLDSPLAPRRFFARAKPRLGILMEVEIWPHLLAAARAAGAQTVLANARMSRRSARGYARAGGLFRPVFASFAAVAAQSRADRRRLRALGAKNVFVGGNLKFDSAPTPALDAAGVALRAAIRRAHPGKKIVVFASTRAGEEKEILRAADADFWRRHIAVFAPRHPRRADEIERLLRAAGLRCGRGGGRDWATAENPAAAYLADVFGELPMLYAAADVALIGGSLLAFGGQNPIEAMARDAAAVIGPHIENLRPSARAAQKQGALLVAASAADALEKIAALCADDARRETQTARARDFAEAQKGALEKTAAQIESLLAAA